MNFFTYFTNLRHIYFFHSYVSANSVLLYVWVNLSVIETVLIT